MKYIVLLGDGMSDYPIAALGGRTPLMAADKPAMDSLASAGRIGLARTLYEGLPTGSDTANLSVLGYDPHLYYTGRSPIEALGMDVALDPSDTVFRMNLCTVSWGAEPFEEKMMLDHSSGKITNPEAYELVEALRPLFAPCPGISLYPGVSYRHILVWKGIDYDYVMTPPHDILTRKITPYLPEGKYAEQVLSFMKKSYDLLMAHPVNQRRLAEGKNPANCIWLWGEGKKPAFESFGSKYGVRGSVVTAVPLIMGLAKGMGLKVLPVEGATGDYYTNYRGKAEAALNALAAGDDFVFLHIEAPDECGHDGDAELKVKSIEKIDGEVAAPIRAEMDRRGEPYRMLILPDHTTPVAVRTHTVDPVPYLIYENTSPRVGPACYDEESAKSGFFYEDAYKLMGDFLKK